MGAGRSHKRVERSRGPACAATHGMGGRMWTDASAAVPNLIRATYRVLVLYMVCVRTCMCAARAACQLCTCAALAGAVVPGRRGVPHAPTVLACGHAGHRRRGDPRQQQRCSSHRGWRGNLYGWPRCFRCSLSTVPQLARAPAAGAEHLARRFLRFRRCRSSSSAGGLFRSRRRSG